MFGSALMLRLGLFPPGLSQKRRERRAPLASWAVVTVTASRPGLALDCRAACTAAPTQPLMKLV